MVIGSSNFENNLTSLFPCFTFAPKTGMEPPEKGLALTVFGLKVLEMLESRFFKKKTGDRFFT